ncbi:MAG: AraC family transcriptional regulator [Rubrivivax sp.]|nr:MAG: AraC family transcriptional regulator [Rubrivivax sp.]
MAPPGADLSGSQVQADKPIQVIAGSPCSNVPSTDTQACDHLEHSRESVAQVGSSLGYDSISAFSTAFKRVLGISPLKYKTALSNQPRHVPSTHPS